MADMNVWCATGRLVADPEVTYTPQGVAVAKMRIAVGRFTKNEAGEYETDFFSLTAWRKSAEFAQQYLHKGQQISVSGRLQQRQWVNSAGEKRSTVEIQVQDMNPVGKWLNQGEGETEDAPPTARPRPAAAATEEEDASDPFADE
jgi:single-strand DNA-binding protein